MNHVHARLPSIDILEGSLKLLFSASTDALLSRHNGKSMNVSETSGEMAVTSDMSEKVHGNIPHLAPTISSPCRPSELYARPT